MPNVDGGHYFLTALFPVRIEPIARQDGTITAPSHSLREVLATLPTAIQSAACADDGPVSPFARCRRTHFARLFVIDQPTYNGRVGRNTLIEGLRKTDLLVAQPADCLATPWLVLVVDFDARPEEHDRGLGSYARGLWAVMASELTAILQHCHGFAATTADEFAAYLGAGQVETTMPFNDYWTERPPLPSLSLTMLVAMVVALFAVLALVELLAFRGLGVGLGWLWLGLPVVALLAAAAVYRFVLHRGERTFPTAPGSDLPGVLKALYLQQAFARFAIGHQGDAARSLHAAFGDFLATTAPGDTAAPTREPGRMAP